MEELEENTIGELVKKKEQLIKQMLPNMPLAEVEQRCRFVSYADQPEIETLTLDGEPLVTFYPLEVETEQIDKSVKMKITTPYKRHR